MIPADGPWGYAAIGLEYTPELADIKLTVLIVVEHGEVLLGIVLSVMKFHVIIFKLFITHTHNSIMSSHSSYIRIIKAFTSHNDNAIQ